MLFPAGSLPSPPPIDTKKALLLLDFQNEFVSPEGKNPIPNVKTFISKLPSLISEFRTKGEVIWCGTEFIHPRSSLSATTGSQCILSNQSLTLREDDYDGDDDDEYTRTKPTIAVEDSPSSSPAPHQLTDPEAFLGPLKPSDARCCLPGSAGVEYPKVLKPAIDQQRDLVFLKSHYSAFVDTPLLIHLRTNLITELYVCGSMSNITVYATVLDAVCHGLQVCVVEDCLGYINERCHIEAMCHMADNMGANGIDYQELRDDLAGILGDVVREQDFGATFEIRLPVAPPSTTRPRATAQQTDQWASYFHTESDQEAESKNGREAPSPREQGAIQHHSYANSESSFCKESRRTSPSHSPPRKRSPSALDPSEQEPLPKSSHKPSNRVSNPRTLTEHPNTQDSQPVHDLSSAQHSQTAIDPAISASMPLHETSNDVDQSEIKIQPDSKQSVTGLAPNQDILDLSGASAGKKKKKREARILGSGDVMGQGDSFLHVHLLDSEDATAAFYTCRNSVQWQKMFHRSGEVPRLVAVQGSVSKNGSQVPVYRHPADESPELQPFDLTVEHLRKEAERIVGHPLNHVLIQWYRNSEDNISEHSDKSLDIVRGSKIVNLSLGARRTMILRTKKSAVATDGSVQTSDTVRPSQRIHLPHNSLFILGPETNRHWLHAIRADKRLPSEKDPTELAFDGERISLTFRHIGTFIDPINNTIWGQGATAKTHDAAVPLKTGAEAEREGEMMIKAFGQENHRSTDWDWDEWYGDGFDVINFETKPTGMYVADRVCA
ncbi:hypothetical protein B0A52_00914 [Exophiala mesophila]|uniref:Fe2OG dioxygenase domain-containing protein n=1 Tax=Exophiala mesophila TaxID=212818 RepID=A0A438NIL1_EXOME|nr:hypothetical protein B0A52_00914 [Exophiala mesophila]